MGRSDLRAIRLKSDWRLWLPPETCCNPLRVIEPTRSKLAAACSTGTTIPSSKDVSLTLGYRIGAEIEKEHLAAGWRRVEWKLGLTNMALWPTQGVDAPFWAPV